MESNPISPVKICSSLHVEIAYVVRSKIKRLLTEFAYVAAPLGDPSTIPFHFLRDDVFVISPMPFGKDAFMFKYERQKESKSARHALEDSLLDHGEGC